ncbi:probable WRKY transcription factor 30 [Setaria italica]|uniref:probable WRKY transcription factor 30 n=1 Tax=Setaria italica TaxID=4555 RepID=UPI00035107AE|nr:probable WRKY transcription factor 30 [Setaria italica]
MAYVPDRDGAMREVVQAYELIKSHQPHFQFCDKEQGLETVNLAQSLLNEALRALHLALSVLNHETSTAGGGAEGSSRSHMLHLFSRSDAAGDVGAIMSQQRRSKRRRSNEETSQVILTDAPHDDGYIWRKYGEKKINGTHFTRNYFRCSYKYDRGCQATKQIQQQSSNDLPIFQVTYNKLGIYAPELAFTRGGSEPVFVLLRLGSGGLRLRYDSFFWHPVKLVSSVCEFQLYTKCNASS